jgi:hypothetical protein
MAQAVAKHDWTLLDKARRAVGLNIIAFCVTVASSEIPRDLIAARYNVSVSSVNKWAFVGTNSKKFEKVVDKMPQSVDAFYHMSRLNQKTINKMARPDLTVSEIRKHNKSSPASKKRRALKKTPSMVAQLDAAATFGIRGQVSLRTDVLDVLFEHHMKSAKTKVLRTELYSAREILRFMSYTQD